MSLKNLDKNFRKSRVLKDKHFKIFIYCGFGHVGPCLSMARDINLPFFKEMEINQSPRLDDYFILSKGHGVPILYSTYAELGLIKEENYYIKTDRQQMQGHPDKSL